MEPVIDRRGQRMLKKLREQLAKVLAEKKAIVDSTDADNDGMFTERQEAQLAELKTKAAELEPNIATQPGPSERYLVIYFGHMPIAYTDTKYTRVIAKLPKKAWPHPKPEKKESKNHSKLKKCKLCARSIL